MLYPTDITRRISVEITLIRQHWRVPNRHKGAVSTSNSDVGMTSQYSRNGNVDTTSKHDFVPTFATFSHSLRRRRNADSTSEQAYTMSMKGCLNVVMQRWKDVVFSRYINISNATILRWCVVFPYKANIFTSQIN